MACVRGLRRARIASGSAISALHGSTGALRPCLPGSGSAEKTPQPEEGSEEQAEMVRREYLCTDDAGRGGRAFGGFGKNGGREAGRSRADAEAPHSQGDTPFTPRMIHTPNQQKAL